MAGKTSVGHKNKSWDLTNQSCTEGYIACVKKPNIFEEKYCFVQFKIQ